MSSTQPQKGGDGVEKQQTSKAVEAPETPKDPKTPKEKVHRALKTLGLWFVLAFVAAVIAALVPSVRPCFQVGLAPCMVAIFTLQPAPPSAPASAGSQPTNNQTVGQGSNDRPSWAKPNFMDWVILLASLIVAVRIMYPPKDLDDASKDARDAKDAKGSKGHGATSTPSGDSIRHATGPSDL